MRAKANILVHDCVCKLKLYYSVRINIAESSKVNKMRENRNVCWCLSKWNELAFFELLAIHLDVLCRVSIVHNVELALFLDRFGQFKVNHSHMSE